ncbi:hypothetical protein BGX38DRAFT_1158941 [Terfezia claveryi]|nr:hypothetical protein BGX38DRAFT_1158941 [Terfezia claveryi]
MRSLQASTLLGIITLFLDLQNTWRILNSTLPGAICATDQSHHMNHSMAQYIIAAHRAPSRRNNPLTAFPTPFTSVFFDLYLPTGFHNSWIIVAGETWREKVVNCLRAALVSTHPVRVST